MPCNQQLTGAPVWRSLCNLKVMSTHGTSVQLELASSGRGKDSDPMFRQLLTYRGYYRSGQDLWRKWPLVLMLTLVASFCAADSSKLAKELRSQNGSKRVNVIIQYRNAPGGADFNKVIGRGGAMNRDLHGGMRGAAFSVPASELSRLSDDPNVAYISPDHPIQATVYSNNPDYYELAAFAQSAWNQYSGSGIGIAVIDSGITNNGDFGNRI